MSPAAITSTIIAVGLASATVLASRPTPPPLPRKPTQPTHHTHRYAHIDQKEVQLAREIEAALLALPNKVIDGVAVDVNVGMESRTIGGGFTSSIYDQAFVNIVVEFTGESVRGPQNLLMVEADKCGDGCSPKLEGMSLLS